MRLMSRTTLALGSACLLVLGGSAQAAPYLLGGGSGGELQIGTGLPLPATQIFAGGMTPVNGGTTCMAGPMGCFKNTTSAPDGPGTAYWPPLLVPPAVPAKVISQNGSTTMGGKIFVPPAVLTLPAPNGPNTNAKGLFPTNPGVFQVYTSISYAWPAVAATLAPGGAPGSTVLTTTGGGTLVYSGGVQAFGGPAQFSIGTGPGAATKGRLGPNGASVAPIASVWINFQKKLPVSATVIGLAGASNPLGLGQPGAPTGAPAAVTAWGPVTAGNMGGAFNLINVPGPSPPMCCTVTPAGSIPSSIPVGMTFPSNMVTNSKGFPWTTGLLTVSHTAASPAEVFYLSGTDMRVAGVGNISLVSGAVSLRMLSGPNANRGWINLVLPEPTAALSAVGALAMLGLCHGLVRRRSR